MQLLARAFINSPFTPILLIGCLSLGLFGLFFTPRQEYPKISVPIFDIFAQYPGATAKQVESLVTDRLERIMQEISGVKHVYSTTQRGAAIITVQFHAGENMEKSSVKIHDKLQSNLDKIPPGVQIPQIKPMSIDDVPLLTITLWSKTVPDNQLRILALEILQKLREVPGTNIGFVVGGRREQMRVEVLIERLAGYGVTLDRIANTIRAANSELTTGGTEFGGTTYNVYSGAFLRTENDIAKLIVGTQGKQPIYLADVAKISHIPEDTRHLVMHYTGFAYAGQHRADGEQAVTIAIAKKVNSNGVDVSNEILDKIQRLKSTLIPNTVQIEVTRNYGATANDKINELLQTMFVAMVILSIISYIGLGIRAAFVIVIVTLIIILLTLWWAMVIGYTIDQISLLSLIFAIIIVAANVIFIVENIFRYWLLTGKTSIDQTIDAVNATRTFTIFTTIIVICALLPLNWISGMTGSYLHPIPILGTTAMILSLFASFTFIPWLALRVHHDSLPDWRALEQRTINTQRMVSKLYKLLLLPNYKLGIIFFLINSIAIIFAYALLYTQAIPIKIFPLDNTDEFSVLINMPAGTALPETANAIRQMAEKLRQLPEVTTIQSYTGTAQPFNFNGIIRHHYRREKPWQGDLLVSLTNKNQRIQSNHKLAIQARHLLTPLARQLGAKITVVETPFGTPVLQTLVAEIYSPDAPTRRQLAADMTTLFTQTSNLVDIDNSLITPHYNWQFQVDTEKAVRRGLSTTIINQNLAMAMGNFKLGDVKRDQVLESIDIVLQVPLANRSDLTTLGALPIAAPNGEIVPLGELGYFVLQLEDSPIHHLDLRSIEYVTAGMEGFLSAPIYGIINVEKLLNNYVAPDGIRISGIPTGLIQPPLDTSISGLAWSGEWTITYETFRDIILIFIFSLLLSYSLTVWYFNDLFLAALVITPIPLTIVSIIIAHWLLSAEFTAFSMLGLIIICSSIIRQSILIIELVKLQVATGLTVNEAVITAIESKMRSILIIAIITAGVSWTLIFDPIFHGLAISIVSGTMSGTLLTLIVIPLGCISLTRHFYLQRNVYGEMVLPNSCIEIEKNFNYAIPVTIKLKEFSSAIPLWLHIWRGTITFILKLITIITLLWRWIKVIVELLWNPPRLKIPSTITPSTVMPPLPPPLSQVENTSPPVKIESETVETLPIENVLPPLLEENNDVNTTVNTTNEVTTVVRRKTKARKLRGIRLRNMVILAIIFLINNVMKNFYATI